MTEMENLQTTIQGNLRALEKMEKPAHKSKKFTAWILSEVALTAMAIVALLKQPSLGWPLATFMTGIVFVMGITTMWYLGKQAATDIFQRGFSMSAKLPEKLQKKFERLTNSTSSE